jgi:uncharacterized protein YndB with AHSA1/START domain
MKKSPDRLALRFERTVHAAPNRVFDAWLDRKVRGTPWSVAEELVLDPKVNGFFYLAVDGYAHYGRFTAVRRPMRIQHTWVSPNTSGEESTVTITFKRRRGNTVVTLEHLNIPNTKDGRAHESGWNYFLDLFAEQFANAQPRKQA